MMQSTSITNYENIVSELGKRQKEVFEALKELEYATNNMIAQKVGLPIDSITGRTNELVKKGVVEQSHVSWCPIRKTKCIYWKIK